MFCIAHVAVSLLHIVCRTAINEVQVMCRLPAMLGRHRFGAEVMVTATAWCITLGCLKAGTQPWWTIKQCLACYSDLFMTAQKQMGQSCTCTLVYCAFMLSI